MINTDCFAKFQTQLHKVPTLEDLERHARVGKSCKCGDCFCCAAETALVTYDTQTDNLKRIFGKMETIPGAAADSLIEIMDHAPYVALQLMVKKDIKFARGLAQNRIRTVEAKARELKISVATYLSR